MSVYSKSFRGGVEERDGGISQERLVWEKLVKPTCYKRRYVHRVAKCSLDENPFADSTQVYDDCVQNNVYYFAVTNLKQWVFGSFVSLVVSCLLAIQVDH